MDTLLLEDWGPHLNDQAFVLLQHASNVAETQKIAITIWHILFVALTDKSLPIYQTTTISLKKKGFLKTDDLAREGRFKRLIQDIQERMESNALYLNLDMYRLACLEVCRERQIQVTDTLILEQVLGKSETVRQILRTHELLLLLESIWHEVGRQQKKTSGPLSYSELSENEVQKLLQQLHMAIQLPQDQAIATLAKIDNEVHQQTFDTVLHMLADILSAKSQRLLILCGPHGSVFEQGKLERVLAYRLGLLAEFETAQSTASDRRHFSGYQLWHLSLHTLRNVSSMNPHFYPAVALKYVIQEARKVRALLLLTELETFSSNSSLDRHVKEILTSSHHIGIIGCYRYYDQLPDTSRIRLGLSEEKVTLVFPQYAKPRPIFTALLDEYYRQHEQDRITFEALAFESLFALEPGIWIDKQRETFPRMAIEIVNNCITTISRGSSYVRDIASDALRRLQILLSPATKNEVQDPFMQTLEQAQSRIHALFSNPEVEEKQGKILITRSLIEAHLFSGETSEFHFPGSFPWVTPQKK